METVMNKFAAILFFMLISLSNGQDMTKIMSLRGTWKFMIDDNIKFADPDYNDKDWEKIHVPDSWEHEGFPGYDGIAWYRYKINRKVRLPQNNILLNLGKIDDVDEVYFNGTLIGSKGTFPPNFNTAYNTLRIYKVPAHLIRKNKENIIAIRVYDVQGPGGLTKGKNIGIYKTDKNFSLVYQNLEGYWKFKSGNDPQWKNPEYDDSFWNELYVPGRWEDQGYECYNGFGWYRKTITIETKEPQHLILKAGRIDDFEKVYFNGHLIGKTMPKYSDNLSVEHNNDWERVREYYIPKSKVNWGGKNTIAISVYDSYRDGGIRNGPVEILTRDEYKMLEDENNYELCEMLDMIFGQ